LSTFNKLARRTPDIVLPEVLASNLHPRKVLEFQPEPLDFIQPVVKYKPGFGTHWRQHRRAFQKNYLDNLSYRQARLTKFILRLRRLASYTYLKAFQLSVNSFVKRSFLTGSFNSMLSILSGWVFLNGLSCFNPYAQVYVGDIILTTFKANMLNSLKVCDDTPNYLEVDELTSTITFVVEPRF
jgi:hypothetical protein